MTVADRVRRTVRTHGLLAPGGRVVVALSGGGADSVALLHLLRDLEAAGDLALAGVAHFNHQLRGADAECRRAVLPGPRGGCTSRSRSAG
jgi:tRNA(Ile)-lysidine synthase